MKANSKNSRMARRPAASAVRPALRHTLSHDTRRRSETEKEKRKCYAFKMPQTLSGR